MRPATPPLDRPSLPTPLPGLARALAPLPLACVLALSTATIVRAQDDAALADPLRAMQSAAIADHDVARPRIYAFGDQGREGVFSTHRSHSNRLVPAMFFSPFVGLESLRGVDPTERDREGQPARHELVDQTQLRALLEDNVDRGAKRVVVMLLDGCDWQTYAAASVVRSGTWAPDDFGTGLAWFDFVPPGGVHSSRAAVVTSPLRDGRTPGGYDRDAGGAWPWSPQDATYLIGKTREDGPRPHAVTDSAASATSIFSGIKTLNGRVNTDASGEPVEPLGRALQRRGFAIATVTDVPFDHASPAAVYANSENRSNYAKLLGPQMLGLHEYDGLDVVVGYGFDAPGDKYLRAEDLERVRTLGRYDVVTSAEEGSDRERLAAAARAVAARRAAGEGRGARLFGFFGTRSLDHAPYRTADGGYDPSPSLAYTGQPLAEETYGPRERESLPRLVDLANAAMTVLEATPERPFLLFVEAGQVDWSLHANNLDHAIGEVLSAEEVFGEIVRWIEANGWWHETVLLVTSDHGHLLDVDLEALRAAVLD